MEKNANALTTPLYSIRLAILFVAPLLSWQIVLITLSDNLAQGELNFAALVLFLIWSPLFFSIPALMMQRERDLLLPSGGGPLSSFLRGVRLLPTMFRRDSGIRTETIASLVGWSALLIAANQQITAALIAVI
jgi:hypothetical protein